MIPEFDSFGFVLGCVVPWKATSSVTKAVGCRDACEFRYETQIQALRGVLAEWAVGHNGDGDPWDSTDAGYPAMMATASPQALRGIAIESAMMATVFSPGQGAETSTGEKFTQGRRLACGMSLHPLRAWPGRRAMMAIEGLLGKGYPGHGWRW